ncbi:MAG: carbohydrate ABC transporter permease [Clostridiaceae bacterium]|jgi:raffinose/stachyose/melibiose transport system permease protein|nr:carbohydrate ABC transporter permease [Clostridiaceae bacterium]
MKATNNKPKALSAFATIILNLIPAVYAVTCIIPVVWIFYSTFKTMPEFAANVLALPKSFLNTANYDYVLTRVPILQSMFNTVRITFFVLFFVILLAFINGYFLARFKFTFRKFIAGLYTCGLFIPIHAILVPTYIIFSALKINNNWYSTILPVVCMELTTMTFLVMGYMATVPRELEEAAYIDGSTFTRTLFTIILPVVKPVLVTCGIIVFFHTWNEFAFSLILFDKESLYTLPLALMRFKGDYVTDYPRIMTSMFVSIVPALLIYTLFSKQIIKGMMTGAIKG